MRHADGPPLSAGGNLIFRREAVPRKWISRAQEKRNSKERATWFDQAVTRLKARHKCGAANAPHPTEEPVKEAETEG